MTYRLFDDRRDAGRRLADALAKYQFPDPVVLALPRGGVPVAAEIARRLGAPLDIILVRKIGAPRQPELAVAAVIDGARPQIVHNIDLMQETGASEAYVREEADRQIDVIERRRALWLGGRPNAPLAGRTAIVVDDGIATGATMRASLQGLRLLHPRTVVVAVPVAARETVDELEAEVDAVVCLHAPANLGAVGLYYRNFTQVTDLEVAPILAAHAPPAERPAGA